jgi:glycosyltransferase involved in cell wall biosynthesis
MSTASPIRILADHGSKEYFRLHRRRIVLESSFWNSHFAKIPVFKIFKELVWGFKCWIVSVTYKNNAPIVTVGYGRGFIFAFLQYIFRFIFKHRSHFMFDLLLEKKRKGLFGLFDSMKMHVFRTSVDRAIVWGKRDIETFSKEYQIPEEKLIYKHFHITLEKYKFEIRNDGYIFAGGNGGRDYETLIKAVSLINYPMFIATILKEVKSLAENYKHIIVKEVSHEEFRKKLAGCALFVECHNKNFFRTAGHQTILNAMWLGKPVILADKRSGEGYIEDGFDGLIVDAGDVKDLTEKIHFLLTNQNFAKTIGKNAQKKIRRNEFKTANCMQSIYNLAIEYNHLKYRTDGDPQIIQEY